MYASLASEVGGEKDDARQQAYLVTISRVLPAAAGAGGFRDVGALTRAEVMAAVGLAQNLGALRALATEGIQQGHMRMHARSVAATAGALPEQVPAVASALCAEGDFSIETAKRILRELKKS